MDQKTRIAELLRQGDLSYAEVAAVVGVKRSTVTYWAAQFGERRKRRLTPEERAEIASRYAAGEGTALLTREYGCSMHSVQRAVRAHGGTVTRGRDWRSLTSEQVQQVLDLHAEGTDEREIAIQIPTTRRLVRAALNNADPDWTSEPWLGGNGYVYRLLSAAHPFAAMGHVVDGKLRIAEHRLVMATLLGRPLTASETVHHVNGDTADNRPGNLQIRSGAHGRGVRLQCSACGSHDVAAVPL